MKRIVALAALAAGFASLAAASATAATVKWTAVAGSPPVQLPLKVVHEYIIPEINKRIAAANKDFKIEWVEAYAQSLAKFPEVFETVEENIAQYGLQFTNFEEAKLPLEQYTRAVPFGPEDSQTASAIDRALRAGMAQMDKMWLEHGQYRLSSAANSGMQIFSTFPVHKVADLKGRKIGASGSYANYLRNTGAVAVNAMMFNAYNDIRNGVYEGYVISTSLAFPFRLQEVMKHVSDIGFAATISPTVSVNKKAMDALPDWAQAIVRDVSKEYGPRYAKLEDLRVGKFKAMMTKTGVQFSDMPHEERKRWAMLLPNLPKAWADSAEKRGLPGRKLLAAYMDQLRAHKVDTLRDWDKE
jgi:TRAP-type C4-dicarboxylate transport system substrate-binding protein